MSNGHFGPRSEVSGHFGPKSMRHFGPRIFGVFFLLLRTCCGAHVVHAVTQDTSDLAVCKRERKAVLA